MCVITICNQWRAKYVLEQEDKFSCEYVYLLCEINEMKYRIET